MVTTDPNAKAQNSSCSFSGKLTNYLNSSFKDLRERFGSELLQAFTGTAVRLIAKPELSTGGEDTGMEEFTEDS